jgi:phosphonate transport system ATP-binding protein
MNVLEARNLQKTLPSGRVLLNNISLNLGRGELVGILGPSGAGKSLTMRCLLGLIKPDAGEVLLQTPERHFCVTSARGRELRLARREMGVIFQGLHLVQRLTVLENVMIGRLGSMNPLRCWIYGFKDSEARAAMELLERMQMADMAGRVTSSLSGGELQRIAITRAMFQRPSMFLADEPISSLDPKNAERIMALLKSLSQDTPVLCSLHQPEMARAYCTRVIGIRGGEIVYQGSPYIPSSVLREIYGAEVGQMQVGAGWENTTEEAPLRRVPPVQQTWAEAGV